MPMQLGAAARRTIEQDDAHRRIPVQIPFELVRVAHKGKIDLIDD
jgi:hypothetical protein